MLKVLLLLAFIFSTPILADTTSGRLIEAKCGTRLRELDKKFIFGSVLIFRQVGSDSIFETLLIRSSTNEYNYKEAQKFCDNLKTQLGNNFTFTFTNNHLDYTQNILQKVKSPGNRELRITRLPDMRTYLWPIKSEGIKEYVGKNNDDETCTIKINKQDQKTKISVLNDKNKVKYEQTFTNAQVDESIFKEIIPKLARYRDNPESDALFFSVNCLNEESTISRNCFKVNFPYNGSAEKHERIEIRYNQQDYTQIETLRVIKKKNGRNKLEEVCKINTITP